MTDLNSIYKNINELTKKLNSLKAVKHELSNEIQQKIVDTYNKRFDKIEKDMKARQDKTFDDHKQQFDKQFAEQVKQVTDELQTLSQSVRERQGVLNNFKSVFNRYLALALSGVLMALFFITMGQSAFDILGLEYLQQATSEQVKQADTWYWAIFWNILFVVPILIFLGVFVWLFKWLHDKLID